MPFVVNGADISQPEGREAYLEVFAYLRGRGVDLPNELEIDFGLLPVWIDSDPWGAGNFLVHCSEHESPLVRRAAAIATARFVKIDPDFTLATIEKLLADDNPEVRGASDYYYEILGGGTELDDFLAKTGVFGVARLIRAVETAINSTSATATEL